MCHNLLLLLLREINQSGSIWSVSESCSMGIGTSGPSIVSFNEGEGEIQWVAEWTAVSRTEVEIFPRPSPKYCSTELHTMGWTEVEIFPRPSPKYCSTELHTMGWSCNLHLYLLINKRKNNKPVLRNMGELNDCVPRVEAYSSLMFAPLLPPYTYWKVAISLDFQGLLAKFKYFQRLSNKVLEFKWFQGDVIPW